MNRSDNKIPQIFPGQKRENSQLLLFQNQNKQ